MKRLLHYRYLFFLILVTIRFSASAQLDDRMNWSVDGNSFYSSDNGAISAFSLVDRKQQILVTS